MRYRANNELDESNRLRCEAYTGGCKNGARFAMLFVSFELGTLDHK